MFFPPKQLDQLYQWQDKCTEKTIKCALNDLIYFNTKGFYPEIYFNPLTRSIYIITGNKKNIFCIDYTSNGNLLTIQHNISIYKLPTVRKYKDLADTLAKYIKK